MDKGDGFQCFAGSQQASGAVRLKEHNVGELATRPVESKEHVRIHRNNEDVVMKSAEVQMKQILCAVAVGFRNGTPLPCVLSPSKTAGR